MLKIVPLNPFDAVALRPETIGLDLPGYTADVEIVFNGPLTVLG